MWIIALHKVNFIIGWTTLKQQKLIVQLEILNQITKQTYKLWRVDIHNKALGAFVIYLFILWDEDDKKYDLWYLKSLKNEWNDDLWSNISDIKWPITHTAQFIFWPSF